MPYPIVNDRRYYVDISGAGDPIVLLHGFTGDTTTWQAVRHGLDSSYQVIAIDILGHGKSDKPATVSDYRMPSVAGDIIDVLEHLSVRRVHLLGYSMGGRLALYLALHYPGYFRSLILESTSPGLQTEQERRERQKRDNALADQIERNGIPWFVKFWEGLSLWDSQKSLPNDVLCQQRDQRLGNDPVGLANSLRGMGTGVQPNLWDSLGQLTLPTQLIVGEYDHKFTGINQRMVKYMPDASLTTIANAGHTAHLENPDAFIEKTGQFLNLHQ